MSDSAVLADLDIWQSGRFYFWHYDDEPPVPAQDHRSHSANWHLVPANDWVWRKLSGLRVGDVVKLDGMLVNLENPGVGTMTTSLTARRHRRRRVRDHLRREGEDTAELGSGLPAQLHVRLKPDLHSLQDRPRDVPPHDLGAAVGDSHIAGLVPAVVELHLVRQSHAAVRLHAALVDARAHLRREELDHGDLLDGCFTAIQPARAVVDIVCAA